MEVLAKWSAAGAGAIVGYLYGGWSIMLQVLLGLAVLDYVTGWLAAGIEGKLNSKVGYRGAAKKIMMLVIVAAAHFADRLIGDSSMIMNAAIFFYAGNEILSLVENVGRSGVPVPAVLIKAVDVLRSKGGDDDGKK